MNKGIVQLNLKLLSKLKCPSIQVLEPRVNSLQTKWFRFVLICKSR